MGVGLGGRSFLFPGSAVEDNISFAEALPFFAKVLRWFGIPSASTDEGL